MIEKFRMGFGCWKTTCETQIFDLKKRQKMMQYQTVITIWYSGSTIAAWNFDLDHRLFPAGDLDLVWVDFEPPGKNVRIQFEII